MTQPKHNIRTQRDSTNSPRTNPIDISAVSQTETGVVRVRKGAVYVDMTKTAESDPEPKDSQWVVVVVRDPYGNIVEMVRNTDVDDQIKEQYINNQSIQSVDYNKATNNKRLREL
jgi:hypothetical protein